MKYPQYGGVVGQCMQQRYRVLYGPISWSSKILYIGYIGSMSSTRKIGSTSSRKSYVSLLLT